VFLAFLWFLLLSQLQSVAIIAMPRAAAAAIVVHAAISAELQDPFLHSEG